MKRSIPRSVLEQMQAKRSEQDVETGEGEGASDSARESIPGGFGGAWKAGAMAQVEGDLTELREGVIEAILAGQRELSLDPEQIDDPLGSDRRPNWEDTDSFVALVDSIEKNGQDVPVQVWPADPDWQPDPRDPLDATGVRFHLLSGRRRRAVCAKLGKPVRGVIMPLPDGATPKGASEADTRFAMLFHRFRENEAREDLSAFERLLSIGEIYEAMTVAGDEAPTAVAFAARIGVHESVVSRARAVLRHRDAILNAFKNPYDLSFSAIQDALAEFEGSKKKPTTKKKPKPKSVAANVEHGGRKLNATLKNGRLTISVPKVDLDETALRKTLTVLAKSLPSAAKARKGAPMVD